MNRLAAIIAALILTACAGQRPLTPEQQLALEPIACSNKNQCDLIWQRVQLWIAQNSRYRVQTATDVLIQTYGPIESEVGLAYRGFRESLPNGSAKISFSASCGNIFGCERQPVNAIAELKKYSVAASESASPPPQTLQQQKLRLGVLMTPVSAQLAITLGMAAPRGAMVAQVAADSPAFRAGIQQGDVIVRIGDSDITDTAAVQAAITDIPPGGKKTIIVRRGSSEISYSVQF